MILYTNVGWISTLSWIPYVFHRDDVKIEWGVELQRDLLERVLWGGCWVGFRGGYAGMDLGSAV